MTAPYDSHLGPGRLVAVAWPTVAILVGEKEDGAMAQVGWRRGSLVAYTEGDGPGRSPAAGARWAWLALAGGLTAAFVGMMSTDTLCPEHRAWVDLIAVSAIATCTFAVVGLVRGWAGAPILASAAALGGVAIGLIDTVHDPSRGRLIAVAFGVVAIGAAVVALRALRVAWWERSRLDAALEPPAMGAPMRAAEIPTAPSAPVDDDQAHTDSPVR